MENQFATVQTRIRFNQTGFLSLSPGPTHASRDFSIAARLPRAETPSNNAVAAAEIVAALLAPTKAIREGRGKSETLANPLLLSSFSSSSLPPQTSNVAAAFFPCRDQAPPYRSQPLSSPPPFFQKQRTPPNRRRRRISSAQRRSTVHCRPRPRLKNPSHRPPLPLPAALFFPCRRRVEKKPIGSPLLPTPDSFPFETLPFLSHLLIASAVLGRRCSVSSLCSPGCRS